MRRRKLPDRKMRKEERHPLVLFFNSLAISSLFRRACRAGLEQRTHPLDRVSLPPGTCALTLREAARQTTMRGRTQRDCAAVS